jgi:hypothetical protein
MRRTREDLQRSNAMQHRDNVRIARENQRLRAALCQAAREIRSTIEPGLFPFVAKSKLVGLYETVDGLIYAAKDDA